MRRLIVGVSGASGAPIAVELLRQLREAADIEICLIMTDSAKRTLAQETDVTPEQLAAMADMAPDCRNIGAGAASGSWRCDGMIVVPCSMKTVAGIVSGYSDNLLLRAADVTLKERRKLVVVPRECPLSTIHLRNLYELSRLGALILPPVLSYYNHPQSVQDCTRHIAGKIMDQFGLEGEGFCRWTGEAVTS